MLAESLTVLRAAYPRASFPPETVSLYAEMLADLDDREVAEACKRIIRRSIYLPAVAEIRREVIEHRLGWPTPGQAWEIVTGGNVIEAVASCPPLVAAYKAMGGSWALKTSTNVGAMRHAFERDYDQLVERYVLEQMGARAMSLPPAGDLELSGEAWEDSSPVERRMARRLMTRNLRAPTEEEKRDAIRVLRNGADTPEPLGDPRYVEAERIFSEADDQSALATLAVILDEIGEA